MRGERCKGSGDTVPGREGHSVDGAPGEAAPSHQCGHRQQQNQGQDEAISEQEQLSGGTCLCSACAGTGLLMHRAHLSLGRHQIREAEGRLGEPRGTHGAVGSGMQGHTAPACPP